MKNEKKIIITDIFQELDLEGDLETTIKSLQKTIKDYKKKGYLKFSVAKEIEYQYGDRDGYSFHRLLCGRLETDEELDERIAEAHHILSNNVVTHLSFLERKNG